MIKRLFKSSKRVDLIENGKVTPYFKIVFLDGSSAVLDQNAKQVMSSKINNNNNKENTMPKKTKIMNVEFTKDFNSLIITLQTIKGKTKKVQQPLDSVFAYALKLDILNLSNETNHSLLTTMHENYVPMDIEGFYKE